METFLTLPKLQLILKFQLSFSVSKSFIVLLFSFCILKIFLFYKHNSHFLKNIRCISSFGFILLPAFSLFPFISLYLCFVSVYSGFPLLPSDFFVVCLNLKVRYKRLPGSFVCICWWVSLYDYVMESAFLCGKIKFLAYCGLCFFQRRILSSLASE